jgi:hypothetical protein
VQNFLNFSERRYTHSVIKNSMKKIILLTLPLLFSACFQGATPQPKTPETPMVSSEVIQPSETTPTEPGKTVPVKPTQKPPVVKNQSTTNTVTDAKTDDMTKELDSLIDEIVSGK